MPSAYAYGGYGGRSRELCKPPSFSDETPARNAVVSSFSDFSFIASSNTDKSTLVVKVNGEVVDVTIKEKPHGAFAVEGSIPQPITQEGVIRISISANSARTCNKSYVYLVKVKP
jgi:hypothetical protein